MERQRYNQRRRNRRSATRRAVALGIEIVAENAAQEALRREPAAAEALRAEPAAAEAQAATPPAIEPAEIGVPVYQIIEVPRTPSVWTWQNDIPASDRPAFQPLTMSSLEIRRRDRQINERRRQHRRRVETMRWFGLITEDRNEDKENEEPVFPHPNLLRPPSPAGLPPPPPALAIEEVDRDAVIIFG